MCTICDLHKKTDIEFPRGRDGLRMARSNFTSSQIDQSEALSLSQPRAWPRVPQISCRRLSCAKEKSSGVENASSPGTMYSTTRPKPLKKPSRGANLQSSQKIWISGACETKLGCVLSFLENAIIKCMLATANIGTQSVQELFFVIAYTECKYGGPLGRRPGRAT